MKRALPLSLLFLIGCQAPGPVRTVDGSGWQTAASESPPPPTAFVNVTALGATEATPAGLAALRKALRQAQQEPLETRALTLANIGIAAAHMGALDDARVALDGALQIMHAVIYDPSKSREIARLPGEERTKIFKGEPHERALCNLYRGLVYLADHDYESARACFRRADMERTAGETGSPSGARWVSLEYLTSVADARCPSQLGIDWMRDIPEELQVDPFLPDENTLVVVMAGLCPSKLHRQGGKEHGLTYGRIASAVAVIEISASDPLLELNRPTEDIFLQAVSNGRRNVDALLAAKQQAAETGQGVGDASEAIGAAIAGIPYVNLALYPLFLAGSLGRGAAAGTDSTADLRSVVGPGLVYIGTLRAGGSQLTLQAKGRSGELLGENHAVLPPGADDDLRVVIVRVYR